MVQPLTEAEKATVTGYQGPEVTPHPDGKPWDKCCGDKNTLNSAGHANSCQCFMRKPRNAPSRFSNLASFDSVKALIKESGRFFCCHRTTDDGFHRECAGWAAKFTKHK
jgi:hypothetical protein